MSHVSDHLLTVSASFTSAIITQQHPRQISVSLAAHYPLVSEKQGQEEQGTEITIN